jgi:hypothetical protein
MISAVLSSVLLSIRQVTFSTTVPPVGNGVRSDAERQVPWYLSVALENVSFTET